jgi:hypothetical protein
LILGRRPDKRTSAGGSMADATSQTDSVVVAQPVSAPLTRGYLSHTGTIVRLYLQETLTFFMLASESAVALAPRATNPAA